MRVGARIGPSRRILSSPHYKWWAYAAIGVGMFVTVMDQSGVSIALPRIAERFSADLPTVQWITLGYVLSTAAMLMPMGRLSDMLGRKPVYLAGLVVFMAAAALGGSAQSFGVIIAAKVVQGIGAAAIQANGLAMIAQVFPENERGKGFGMYMAVIGAGSIGGPVIGGLLVSALGWRSVFFRQRPAGPAGCGDGRGDPSRKRDSADGWQGQTRVRLARRQPVVGLSRQLPAGRDKRPPAWLGTRPPWWPG